jgi:hypothetical protein
LRDIEDILPGTKSQELFYEWIVGKSDIECVVADKCFPELISRTGSRRSQLIRQTQFGLMFPEQFHAETVYCPEERQLKFLENCACGFTAHSFQQSRPDSTSELARRVVRVSHDHKAGQQISAAFQSDCYDPFDNRAGFSSTCPGDQGEVPVNLPTKAIYCGLI